MSSTERKKIFYGWYVVAAGCAVIAFDYGMVTNCFGQFIKPVCAGLGFTREQMSLNQTITSIISMLVAMFWGQIHRRIKLHRAMCVSAVVVPLLFASYSFAPNLAVFYTITVLLSIANSILTLMVLTFIISNWFVEHRGVALGLTSMGSGLGAMIMNTVISQLILSYGWQAAYRILGAFMGVVIIPCVWFVIREYPQDKGLLPYGMTRDTKNEEASASRAALPAAGVTYAEARRSARYWLLFAATVLVVTAINIFYPTEAPHLSDSGYSVTFAAVVASVSMGAMAAGKVLLGRLFDRFGTLPASLTACLATLAGTLGLIWCRFTPMLALIVFGVALGSVFGAMCLPFVVSGLFGPKDYDTILGKQNVAVALGCAAGPYLSGMIYDTAGSYVPAYWLGAGMTVVGIVVLIGILKKRA